MYHMPAMVALDTQSKDLAVAAEMIGDGLPRKTNAPWPSDRGSSFRRLEKHCLSWNFFHLMSGLGEEFGGGLAGRIGGRIGGENRNVR